MSAKLDLYIEKLVEKMNLDEVQRVEVEKEIRGHLDEAISKGIRAGLSEEEAEKEALLAFGEPSFLGRQFGIVSGYGWWVFEICASSLVTAAFAVWTAVTFNVPFYLAVIIGVFAFVMSVISQLRLRVEVNGTL
jgi:hypothetical protein